MGLVKRKNTTAIMIAIDVAGDKFEEMWEHSCLYGLVNRRRPPDQ